MNSRTLGALVLTIRVCVELVSGHVVRCASSASGGGASSYSGSAAATPVTWQHLVNCSVLGAALEKTTGCNGCPDTSASSVQSIGSGGGYLQFTVDNNRTDRYC